MTTAWRGTAWRLQLCTFLTVYSTGCSESVRGPVRDRPSSTDADMVAVDVIGAEDTTIGPILSMARFRDGYWAITRGKERLALFGLDGNPRRHFLTNGNGPDQVGAAMHVDVDADGHAIIWDGLNSRVLKVAPSGSVEIIRRGTEWKADIGDSPRQLVGGAPLGIAAMDGGLVAAVVEGPFRDASDFVRATLVLDNAQSRMVLWSFGETQQWLDSLLPQMPLRRPFPLWTRCGRNALAIYDPRDQAVRRIDLNGKVLGQWKVAQAPQTLTEEQVRWFVFHQIRILAPPAASDAQLQRMAFDAPREAVGGYSNLAPAYVRIRCSESGTVYLQRFEVSRHRAAGTEVWDVISSTGVPRVLRLPTNFQLKIAEDSALVGVLTDLMDVPHLAVGRVPASP